MFQLLHMGLSTLVRVQMFQCLLVFFDIPFLTFVPVGIEVSVFSGSAVVPSEMHQWQNNSSKFVFWFYHTPITFIISEECLWRRGGGGIYIHLQSYFIHSELLSLLI